MNVTAVVAHQDDDLLFMNPDIMHALDQGGSAAVLYLTAGDGGAPSYYWQRREMGAKAAYAYMAGVNNVWTESRQWFSDKLVSVSTLGEPARVRLYFLRLPDGNPIGSGFRRHNHESLQKLWCGERAHTLDKHVLYTREDLIDVIRAFVERYTTAGDVVWTLYPGEVPGASTPDHSDHRHTGLFTREAAIHPIRYYHGYPVVDKPKNIEATVLEEKMDVFRRYTNYDEDITIRDCLRWVARQYTAEGL